MNPQMVAQQQRYLQQQHQAQFQAQQHQQPRPHHPQQPSQGHPGQHGQHAQHPQQRRPMGAPQQQRPRTAQQQAMDQAAHLSELQQRYERSLAAAKRPTDHTIPDSVDELVLGDGVKQYKRMRDVERRLDAMMMRKIISIEQEVEMEEEGGSANPLAASARRQYRTMRIWITNTVENQPWQGSSSLDENAFDFDSGADPRYRVKIVGKIIDGDPTEQANGMAGKDAPGIDDDDFFDTLDSDNESDADAMEEDGAEGKDDGEKKTDARPGSKEGPGSQAKPDHDKPEMEISKILEKLKKRAPPLKLSNCFEKISIDFDRSQTLQTEATSIIEWKRPDKWNTENPPHGSDFDTLEFERKGDESLHCTIHLHRQSHGLYKLSDPLADLLQMKEATRPEVVQALWQYIRLSRLPQEEEKGLVQCDEALRKVFNTDVMHLKTRLHEHLAHHLSPLPAHALPYTIRMDQEFHANAEPTVYDVPIPYPVDSEARGSGSSPSLARLALASLVHAPVAKRVTGTIAARDGAQAAAVAALGDARARRAFFKSMADDPSVFVRRWLASQRRDLECILGDARFGNPDAEQADWERWMADEFRAGGPNGVWGSEGVRESVELLVRQHR